MTGLRVRKQVKTVNFQKIQRVEAGIANFHQLYQKSSISEGQTRDSAIMPR